jgi:hypothetical protein
MAPTPDPLQARGVFLEKFQESVAAGRTPASVGISYTRVNAAGDRGVMSGNATRAQLSSAVPGPRRSRSTSSETGGNAVECTALVRSFMW